KEFLEVEVGEDISLEIGFNPRFFIEALTAMTSELVNINFTATEGPCIVTGDNDPGYLSVMMPMKI
ncbi:MAG: DNA polymerase III subunit beta, partial [Deltaproteobacteria bacterium]|nr:DNA polymerase III subunit beta [Deltaproteobacteria bacterium]